VAVGTDHSGDIQLNELLQAVARQPGGSAHHQRRHRVK
jgi:hypothetical protein